MPNLQDELPDLAGSGVGGFDNPSVYCADLYRLITHIRLTLARDLAVLRHRVG